MAHGKFVDRMTFGNKYTSGSASFFLFGMLQRGLRLFDLLTDLLCKLLPCTNRLRFARSQFCGVQNHTKSYRPTLSHIICRSHNFRANLCRELGGSNYQLTSMTEFKRAQYVRTRNAQVVSNQAARVCVCVSSLQLSPLQNPDTSCCNLYDRIMTL